MKPKTIILLVVAVGCGLGASIMTSRLLADRRKADEPEPTVDVLVATARVAGWTAIKEPEKAFEKKAVPVSFAPKRPVSDFAELKDQKLNKSVGEGHLLLKDDLLTKEQLSVIDQLLPGQRAVAVKVNAESLGGGWVLPATRVDVLCTMRGDQASAKLILQDMLVMAVGDQDQRNPEQKSMLGQTVTLAATPEQAGRLSLGASLGELRLLPKGHGDTSRVGHFEVKPDDLKQPARAGQRDDRVAAGPVSVPPSVLPLPELKPEEKKAEPKKEVVQGEEKAAAKQERHTMKIIVGSSVTRRVFNSVNKRDDDEDEEGSSATAGPEGRPEPMKADPKPVTKSDPKPAAAMPPRTGARAGRTRVGS